MFERVFFKALPRNAARLAAPSLPGAAAAFAAAALAKRAPGRTAFVITSSLSKMAHVYGDLYALGRESGVTPRMFPQQTNGDPEAAGLRLRMLDVLRNTPPSAAPCVVIAPVVALLQPVPDPDAIEAASVTLRVGEQIDFEALVAKLVTAGYVRVTDVDAPGQLAVRGGILDVWSPAAAMPWRADFLGADIESLRTFDPLTQRSVAEEELIWLPPCSEAPLPTLHMIDLLPPQVAVLWIEHDSIEEAVYFATHRTSSWETFKQRVAAREPWLELYCGEPPPPQMPGFPLDIAVLPGLAELGAEYASHPELLAGARKRLLADFTRRANAGEQVTLCADTAGTCELLAHELGPDTRIRIHRAALSGGFVLPGLALATQSDLYTVRKHSYRPNPPATAAARGGRVENAADLEPGDLVVHVDHGIGRFLGSTEVEVNGQRSEVFSLEYAGGAKLHVPVSHAHLLSRYVGVAGHKVKQHHLGGKRWTKEKVDAERAVADLAASLLETQAKRSVVEGIAFDAAPPWLHEFEAAFPYQETADQEKVIAEVKRDMAASRPMDRLICGDAGYGKTEIAMRAAFIAVMNGRQVAVLVPTTVLAEQHFETFADRMAAYPVRIEAASRFQSLAKRRSVLEAVAEGRVDIVIGTHALLASGVAFQNLGLLIIDEEQRFGVTHKERLKLVRQSVDVLTLSATPIPRTLYMSMTGARDLSLLQTPPCERLAVETNVARDADNVICGAIRKEINRNGQVYFLYNRVMTIHLMEQRIRRLVPEARVAIAHGQMPPSMLAKAMRQFEHGEIDVLLCTTLVENGIDIPRANTILVHRADRFGIADLYQLRGRVGRSSQKGFAWLLTPETGYIDSDARQRIDALLKHSGLGAGFNLALRDLEIRGAGNLLGAAQSGHIAAIGFGLYCQLLRRTIARMKGEAPPLLVDVDMSIDFLDLSPGTADPDRAACLPYGYVEDEGHRLIIHRRLAETLSLKEVKALREELADRYGKPPPPALRLLRLAEIRILAAQKKIGRIETSDGKIYLYPSTTRTPLLLHNHIPRLHGKNADAMICAILNTVKAVGQG